MVVSAISLGVRPITCSCKKSYDKVITQAVLSHPRTTLSCSRAPAAHWHKTVRKILCVCFVHRSLSDASDRTCSVRPYFYLRLFLRVHSDQIEFCVSYDFLIASSRAPIVKAPLQAVAQQQKIPTRSGGTPSDSRRRATPSPGAVKGLPELYYINSIMSKEKYATNYK